MHEFTKQLKKLGWTGKEVAERWGISQTRISQISANPTARDWDALTGLPNMAADIREDVLNKTIEIIIHWAEIDRTYLEFVSEREMYLAKPDIRFDLNITGPSPTEFCRAYELAKNTFDLIEGKTPQ